MWGGGAWGSVCVRGGGWGVDESVLCSFFLCSRVIVEIALWNVDQINHLLIPTSHM